MTVNAHNSNSTPETLDRVQSITLNLPPHQPFIISNDRDSPPLYEEAVNPNAPPPSYESLYGRIREAHKSCKSIFDFFINILVLFLGTIGCTIIVGIQCFIPICMMVIGGVYLYDCPQGEFIPIYLLIGGGFAILQQLLILCIKIQHPMADEESIRQSSTQTLLNCFISGWFIMGSIWVYKEYEPNYDPALGKYCNKTLYLFAFWLITITYITVGIYIYFVCNAIFAALLSIEE